MTTTSQQPNGGDTSTRQEMLASLRSSVRISFEALERKVDAARARVQSYSALDEIEPVEALIAQAQSMLDGTDPSMTKPPLVAMGKAITEALKLLPQQGRSKKRLVIDAIFKARWRQASESLDGDIVTIPQVKLAIERANDEHNMNMSSSNPANFFKDFIRNAQSANNNWPRHIFEKGYTGRQLTGREIVDGQFVGDSRCFKFAKVTDGRRKPFVAISHEVVGRENRIRVQSVSMPAASRRLGRSDETWMIQVVIRLRVIETHFALVSTVRRIEQIDHLQTGIKQSGTEIDALFLAREPGPGGAFQHVLMTCEAKSLRDDILEHQCFNQVVAALKLARNCTPTPAGRARSRREWWFC